MQVWLQTYTFIWTYYIPMHVIHYLRVSMLFTYPFYQCFKYTLVYFISFHISLVHKIFKVNENDIANTYIHTNVIILLSIEMIHLNGKSLYRNLKNCYDEIVDEWSTLLILQ